MRAVTVLVPVPSLTLVANALALVGLRLPQLADVRGDFANLLLVDALNLELNRALDREGDALGCGDNHGVAEAELEFKTRASSCNAVAGADDLESLLEARRNTDDHVGDQSASQSVQCTGIALIVGTSDNEVALFFLDLDRRGDLQVQSALEARNRDGIAGNIDLDSGGNRNRHTPNT